MEAPRLTARKHWFRVADSILYEPWSDRHLATLIRLMAWLNTRWARNGLTAEKACTGLIPYSALKVITNHSQPVRVRSTFNECAASVHCACTWRAEGVQIEWPKFAEYQRLHDRDRPSPQTPPQDAPADATKNAPDGAVGVQKRGGDEPEAKAPSPAPEVIAAVWSRNRDAANAAGKSWSEAPSLKQAALLRTRLGAYSADQLSRVAEGYLRLHGSKRNGEFDPLRHLTLTTLLRPSNIDKYLEALHEEPRRGGYIGAAGRIATRLGIGHDASAAGRDEAHGALPRAARS